MKLCAKCKETKSADCFRKDTRMISGLNSYCKTCIATIAREKRQKVFASEKPIVFSKRCYKCKETKARAFFSMERGNADGLTAICKTCRSLKHLESHAKNPDEYRRKAREANKRMMKNPSFVIHKRVSARVGEWLRTKKGGKRTFDLIGYSLPELKVHLERQFVKGMSWDNLGKWHIDHIVPLSAFDESQIKEAWALPNLRPLWAKQNLTKNNKREFLL